MNPESGLSGRNLIDEIEARYSGFPVGITIFGISVYDWQNGGYVKAVWGLGALFFLL